MLIKGVVARQSHGAPMGSPTSPSKAVITCSPPEAALIQEATRRQVLMVAARYMDDLILLLAFAAGCDRSKAEATAIANSAVTMYPPPLVLEVEESKREFDFLESKVMIAEGEVWVRLRNHNMDAV